MRNFILREGFWKEAAHPELPVPLALDSAWEGQVGFLAALTTVELYAQKDHCKGWSTCRCCGRENGSAEYSVQVFGIDWAWPAGYKHYMEDHNVRPSLAFQEFILAVHSHLSRKVV